MDSHLLNKNMIEGQIKPIGGMQKNILQAFSSVNRDDFVPQNLKDNCYSEKNLFLKRDRFVLKANLIAKIISALNISNEENVLVIGSSTGYSSAIISRLAETVISIEEDQELLDFSEEAIKKNGIDNIVFINNPMIEGCSEQGPFNAIIIEGAIDEVPPKILNQLEDNGRLIAMINNKGVSNVIEYKKKNNIFIDRFLFSCTAPKLKCFDKRKSFSF
jgi:protein-L-isoaspartate(D-aspartate) O-methyltransferase